MEYKYDLNISVWYEGFDSGARISLKYSDDTSKLLYSTEDSEIVEALDYIGEQGSIKKNKAKAFNIANDKLVNFGILFMSNSVDDYNNKIAQKDDWAFNLTEEEYNLLREMRH